MEIERKFLLDQPGVLAGHPGTEIEQGYLITGVAGEARLRRKGGRLLLTVKHGEGLSRVETEIELDESQFEELWPLTEGQRIRKQRYVILHPGHEIEVDVYEGPLEGLVVAEVEFDSERAAGEFEPPEWLGKEVTGDREYSNQSLAVHGAPER